LASEALKLPRSGYRVDSRLWPEERAVEFVEELAARAAATLATASAPSPSDGGQ
jgi:hypothetical protein